MIMAIVAPARPIMRLLLTISMPRGVDVGDAVVVAAATAIAPVEAIDV